jgi:DNA topoisomerase-6 subunit B
MLPDISEKIKEISISEFFEKNRHLLGYENPAKAFYTVVKELVDNSIDACLEARILPEIYVKVKKVDEERIRVRVEDNGPGISPKKLPIAFGKFLVGSKFYRLRQSIGFQGIGAKGAILYSQLTTNKPAKIWSATINSKEIHYFELMIDVLKNEPLILKHEVKENKDWHGTIVEMEFEGRYTSKVDEYLELIWLVNPYVRLIYEKDGEKKVYERVTNDLPQLPKEIKPHPYGIEIGILKRLISQTKFKTLIEFLTNEFSRIGKDTAKKIIRLSRIYDEIEISDKTVEEYLKENFKENFEKITKIAENVELNKKLNELSNEEKISLEVAIASIKNPKELKNEEIEKLFKAMQKVKIRAPPTDCLSPIDEKYLIQALKKIFKAEMYSVVTRKPSVYRGFPFQVQAAIVYGLKEFKGDEEIQNVKILRFANHTPLLYNLYDCAITKAIMQINWNSYGISQSGNLPNEPMVIIVDFLSVWIPFKSEGKQAIAEYPEIIKEIKLALQEAARKVYRFILKKRKYELLKEKRNIFERYIPEVAKELAKVTNEKEETILLKLKEIADKKVPELFKIEKEIKS